ncbi:enoyl-CoA hydratase, putative [Acanthamoeba castellanii str. Neff]|uniref:Enoyl-CoA hydratase, putative n=1 Tax=Acanthamoeba castellanii (strain ATCC 30010 / Neff) TaxID=1257118 RepID=L8HA73_ACACF|nr:enoyl-CoA hydratase, putative [Acanthamoeba castellanii str. Neff]ELR22080.1 enoyl-CoA hydratase, putative [Acanthamoeba castellanii str. Neff]
MEGTAASSTGVRRVARLAHHLHEQHLGAVIRLAPHGVAADAPSTTSVVLVERQGSSGVVILVREVMATLKALDRDSSVRCIVLTGSDRAFAAGADIKEMSTKTMVEMSHPDHFINVIGQAALLKKPLVGAVNGYALGGGCELAMMCDILIAGENAQFGQPEVKVGTIPGIGGTQRLTRAIGKSKAMEMVLTGKNISAAEAERMGLVSRVVPVDKTLATAIEVAQTIAGHSMPIVEMAKDCVNRAYESSLTEGINYERHLFYASFATVLCPFPEDQKEGMKAFAEKRKASWHDK